MPSALLVLLSASVLAVLHHSLKRIFVLIEKAHESQRKPGPRSHGVQLSGEKAA